MIASRHACHRGRGAVVVACLLIGVGEGHGSAADPLADLAGKPVRLVVELNDADVYAIRFGAPARAAGE